MADYVYLVQMDISVELEDDFNRIYDTQHIPNIIKAPGVHSCTRYKLVSADVAGVARYAAVYEVDSPEVPTSADWVTLSDTGDWATQIRPHTTNRSHIIFQKL
ncbi:MAG: DUF4286 family protein [Dehalococcoidia bacterium]